MIKKHPFKTPEIAAYALIINAGMSLAAHKLKCTDPVDETEMFTNAEYLLKEAYEGSIAILKVGGLI